MERKRQARARRVGFLLGLIQLIKIHQGRVRIVIWMKPQDCPGLSDDTQHQQLREELTLQMTTAGTQFHGTDPLSRHRLSKLHYSYRLKTAVSIINQDVLPQYLHSVGNIEDLQ